MMRLISMRESWAVTLKVSRCRERVVGFSLWLFESSGFKGLAGLDAGSLSIGPGQG